MTVYKEINASLLTKQLLINIFELADVKIEVNFEKEIVRIGDRIIDLDNRDAKLLNSLITRDKLLTLRTIRKLL